MIHRKNFSAKISEDLSTLWRKHCNDATVKPRGNSKSSVIFIVPPCTQEEADNNTVFATKGARAFDSFMHQNYRFYSDLCFVVPCSTQAGKANKQGTTSVRNFIADSATLDSVVGYVCLGGDAFKFIFGFGKKPKMESLVGNVIFDVTIGHKPVFIFNDIKGICPEFTGDYRTDRGLEEWRRICSRELQRTAEKFKTTNIYEKTCKDT